ncbi:predicted protein, partial [Nematostella vectensis]
PLHPRLPKSPNPSPSGFQLHPPPCIHDDQNPPIPPPLISNCIHPLASTMTKIPQPPPFPMPIPLLPGYKIFLHIPDSVPVQCSGQ